MTSTLPDAVTHRVRDSLPLLLSASEVAAELSMSTSWVRTQIRAGKIPATKLGRQVRVTRENVLLIAERGLDEKEAG